MHVCGREISNNSHSCSNWSVFLPASECLISFYVVETASPVSLVCLVFIMKKWSKWSMIPKPTCRCSRPPSQPQTRSFSRGGSLFQKIPFYEKELREREEKKIYHLVLVFWKSNKGANSQRRISWRTRRIGRQRSLIRTIRHLFLQLVLLHALFVGFHHHFLWCNNAFWDVNGGSSTNLPTNDWCVCLCLTRPVQPLSDFQWHWPCLGGLVSSFSSFFAFLAALSSFGCHFSCGVCLLPQTAEFR